MSITYEEALATLNSMFSSPWDEESLDTVLRHFEGHMENTVDAVLTHGEADPQILLQQLESSKPGEGVDRTAMDEQYARELAAASGGGGGGGQVVVTAHNPPSSSPANSNSNSSTAGASPSEPPRQKGRGTPTELPPDFLRLNSSSADGQDIYGDEALARMLQDKLFTDEIKNNPEFAHLATQRNGGSRHAPGAGINRFRGMGGPRNQHQQNEGPNIMEALGSMGENARKRFQELAVKVKTNINNVNRMNDNNAGQVGTGAFGGSSGFSERRGLLDLGEDDDAEQEISFLGNQRNTNYEMRDLDSATTAAGKKSD